MSIFNRGTAQNGRHVKTDQSQNTIVNADSGNYKHVRSHAKLENNDVSEYNKIEDNSLINNLSDTKPDYAKSDITINEEIRDTDKAEPEEAQENTNVEKSETVVDTKQNEKSTECDSINNNKPRKKSEICQSDNDGNEPVVVASIINIVSSEIFQDILKENNIPFICRQRGAGGSIKILFGGGVVPDDIYVAMKNYEKAKELYEVYLNSEMNTVDELKDEADENDDLNQ